MAKKKHSNKDPLQAALLAIVEKLKDEILLFGLGLLCVAGIVSGIGAAAAELAFGAAVGMYLAFLIFKSYCLRSQERTEALRLENDRTLKLERIRTNANRQNLPRFLPLPRDPK